jgi:hypothetical protein
VIDYQIWYGLQSAVFTLLDTGVTTSSYTTSVTLVPGEKYKFRVQSRNSVGLSLFSSELVVIAARIPDIPTAVLTERLGPN